MMSKLKIGIKFFIFLTLPLFLIALPFNSYASFLFSDNFASPTVQKLDVYNTSYHNLQTADSDGGTVYNGKMYLNGQSGTPNDYYTYTGLGSVSNLCSIVTGVPMDGELGVQLLGSPTNIFHGEVDYGIYGSATAFSGHARLYLNGNPSDLGPINIDFTQSHIVSVCENGNQITFTVDNNVIDQRTISFTPTWPGFSIFSTNAYITNYSVGQAPTLVTAVNAGGDTEGNFAQDTYYNGGSTFTTSTSVDTSNVSNPAPEAVYQSLRYGNFSYAIPNLTANGTYTLQLHFSEPYWGTSQAGGGGVGSRLFNVSVNGTQVLSDFDVYQAAGGANKAVMEQIPATADSNGSIIVTFTNVVDNAIVSGIAVYNGSLPAPTPTPTPTPVSSLAISAGGQGVGNFVADTDYTGGSTYTTSANIDTSSVSNPAPQAVYQSDRYGNFIYTIPTYNPNSNYNIKLHFSEPYWQSVNSRLFNVSINGTQVLNNFDVYQTAGGENKAVVEQFSTTSDSNGFIKVQFNSVVDNAIVSGIEISQ